MAKIERKTIRGKNPACATPHQLVVPATSETCLMPKRQIWRIDDVYPVDVISRGIQRSNRTTDDQAHGDKDAAREVGLMIGEKFDAAFEATAGLIGGVTGSEIIEGFRQKVAANADRLSNR